MTSPLSYRNENCSIHVMINHGAPRKLISLVGYGCTSWVSKLTKATDMKRDGRMDTVKLVTVVYLWRPPAFGTESPSWNKQPLADNFSGKENNCYSFLIINLIVRFFFRLYHLKFLAASFLFFSEELSAIRCFIQGVHSEPWGAVFKKKNIIVSVSGSVRPFVFVPVLFESWLPHDAESCSSTRLLILGDNISSTSQTSMCPLPPNKKTFDMLEDLMSIVMSPYMLSVMR